MSDEKDWPHIFVALRGIARGHPLTINSVQKLLTNHAHLTHVDAFHAHLLRHTGITHLLQQEMSEPAVRTFVGHRHPASSQPYLHWQDDFIAHEFAHAQQGFQHETYHALLGKENIR